MILPVILSGGAGTRLWPLSRAATPKPFLPMPDGETLLAKTAKRAWALPGVRRTLTVTNREHHLATRELYDGVDADVGARAAFLLEPMGRNTAPAIALAALWAQRYGSADDVLVVLPADHLIANRAAFAAAVTRAVALAQTGRLVTFGITPAYPDTGFGYIECGEAGEALRFVEKPQAAQAREYVASGRYLWNSGMFVFTAGAILNAFARHAPEILAAACRCCASWPGAHEPMPESLNIEAGPFATVPDISIDYAVMEKAAAAGDVEVVRGTFDWSDVGSWQAITDLAGPDADGNGGKGERISVATRGTYVDAGERVVATVGVENLVVVDTPDAVLVAHRDHLQKVKDVVGELKARGHDAYRNHRTVSRPWGSYTVLHEGPGFKIKRIEVRSGASLSLQLHHHRSEHWVVVHGTAQVTRGDEQATLAANESTFIPVGVRHRLANTRSLPLVIVEIQCGDYLGEDDIVRFEDRYGRAAEPATAEAC
ncbi:MAG: mannose-1-phosphate guanylyltransferase/mannose-6-phosphate isomerase [Burkholderiales bacterium]